MGDVIDIRDRIASSSALGYPFLSKAEAKSDPILAAMFLLAEDLLWMIPDLPARTIVAVTAIVFLDQFGDELPQDVIDALEVCRR